MTEIRVRKSFDNGAGQRIEEFIVQDEPIVQAGSMSEALGEPVGEDAGEFVGQPLGKAMGEPASEATHRSMYKPLGEAVHSSLRQDAEQATLGDLDDVGNLDGATQHHSQKRKRSGKRNDMPKRSAAMKQHLLNKTPKKLRNPSEMQVRIRTGAIYITLTVFCVLASDISTALYLSALSAICAGEFYFILRSDAKLPNELLGIIAAALLPLAMWLFGLDGVAAVMVVFVLVLLVWYVFWMPARIVDVAVSLFGAVYIGLSMAAAMMLRMALPEFWGGVLVLGLFMSIWANDVFAYLVGSAIGKHKLAPSVSPKKSWEGFIAGLLFSMGFWCLLTLIPPLNMSIPQALAFGFIAGLAGVLGDLVESRIKRNSGVKDSGTIMPGHGGLFDRCDSQFPVTIISVLLLLLFNCVTVVG